MRTIALEEHFVSPVFVIPGPGKEFIERLKSRRSPRGASRIHEQLPGGWAMRASPRWMPPGLDVQVLSLNSPGVEQSEAAEQIAVARDANDFLADAIKKHPTRLAGFAVLPDRRA